MKQYYAISSSNIQNLTIYRIQEDHRELNSSPELLPRLHLIQFIVLLHTVKTMMTYNYEKKCEINSTSMHEQKTNLYKSDCACEITWEMRYSLLMKNAGIL